MKKSETVVRLEAECHARQSECDRLREALGAVMSGEAHLIGQFTLDGQTVKGRLIGWDRAHGGLLLTSMTMRKADGTPDRPMHGVGYLEQMQAEFARSLGQSDYTREMYLLIGRAVQKAYQLRKTGQHDAHIQTGKYEAGCAECERVASEVRATADAADSWGKP